MTPDGSADWDVLVIGAGAGGLFTAARLAHQGYRTLVVERLDKVGGRASTDDIDGLKGNNGRVRHGPGGNPGEALRGGGGGVRRPGAASGAAVPDRRQGRRRH